MNIERAKAASEATTYREILKLIVAEYQHLKPSGLAYPDENPVITEARRILRDTQGHRQGFDKETGELLVVFTVGDVQEALADRATLQTCSEAAALEFMSQYDNKLVERLIYDWDRTIADAARDLDFNPALETPTND